MFMNLVDSHRHTPEVDAIASGSPEQVQEWIEHGAPGRFSVGLHPWSLCDLSPREIESQIKSAAALSIMPEVVAIGEVGIDKLRCWDTALQTRVFQQFVAISENAHKPLVLHIVKGIDEVLKVHKTVKPDMPWIWHGFRGKLPLAEQWLNYSSNFYISIGEWFNPDAVAVIPTERLLIETDESKLTIEEIGNRVAEVRGVDGKQILNLAQSNLARVLSAHGVFPAQSI